MNKLKLGTKVRVTGTNSYHAFEVGEICTVVEADPNDDLSEAPDDITPLKGMSAHGKTMIERTRKEMGDAVADLTEKILSLMIERGGEGAERMESLQYLSPDDFEVIEEGEQGWEDVI